MNDPRRAVVIGGGVIGCSTAYHLARLGCDVCLVEAGVVGHGCSHGNCGFICPSHVLPLNMPGAVSKVLRQMLRRDSPIYVRPQLDPGLWRWLLRFAGRCRAEYMLPTARARHALLSSSMNLYRQWLDEQSLSIEWHHRGLLMVYRSPKEFEDYQQTAEMVRREFGIEATPLDARQLLEREPALRPGLAGGWHFPGDAHLRPDRLLMSLAELLRKMNVEILEHTRVKRINLQSGIARGVEIAGDTLPADVVIVATGAEVPEFARQLGCPIPIRPGKGYSVTFPPPGRPPVHPMIFEEYHVAVTPWESGLRIGSTMEFVGYDRSINARRLALFERAAAEYLVEPPTGSAQEQWWGWRPMSYDDLPAIGPSPAAANVIVAAGHGMIGIASGPASGKLAAELATDIAPHVDPQPYSLQRFARSPRNRHPSPRGEI